MVTFIAIVVGFLTLPIGQKLNDWTRHNEVAHTAMMSLHLMDFISGSGGYYGPANNYFAWKWQKEFYKEDRSTFNKLMFPVDPYIIHGKEEWPFQPTYEGAVKLE